MQVRVTEGSRKYTILKPVQSRPRLDKLWLAESLDDFLSYVADIPVDESWVSLDWETRGLQIADPTFTPVGIGLSCSIGSIYLDLLPSRLETDFADTEIVTELLRSISHLPLIAHNLFFDGGVWMKYLPEVYPFRFDTYGGYRHLACEGFIGQTWGLKDAQRDQLCWLETNEPKLDRWLIEAGYIKSRKKERKKGYYWWGDRWVKPDKAEMWRAPPEILGHYCALDCDSTWQLMTFVLAPAIRKIPPQYMEFHQRDYLKLVEILDRQWLHGTHISVEKFETHKGKLEAKLAVAEANLRAIPEVAEYVDRWEGVRLAEYLAKEPDKYRKEKLRREPPRLTKSGEVSKNWLNWKQWSDSYTGPEVSKNWIRWRDNLDIIKAGSNKKYNKKYKFNFGSGKQLKKLLYEELFLDRWVEKKPYENEWERGCITFTRVDNGKDIDLEYTKAGALPTDGDALLQMGEVGAKLMIYNEISTELGYTNAILENQIGGRIHFQVNCPGTLTGRLGGSGGTPLNIMPKSQGFLAGYCADPGYILVDADESALEPHVLTEYSGDETLLKLYGEGAGSNDSYLFFGSQLPILGDKIREAGYDPDEPTEEGIDNAKKTASKERKISKVFVLSDTYGAGAWKKYRTLQISGIDVSYDDVKIMHDRQQELLGGVQRFRETLEREWRSNGGWILNGVGRPIGIAERVLKDLVSRFCQSTGHDVTIKWIRIVDEILTERGIDYSWYIADYHDEMILQVRRGQEAEVAEILEVDSMDLLNRELDGTLRIKSEACISEDLWEFKK